MLRILFTSVDALIAGFILIPVYWYANRKYLRDPLRSGMYLLFSLYLCAVFSVAGLPDIRYMRFRPNINLEPFAYMFSDWSNSLLNVVLFLPMGFLLPKLWPGKFPLWKALVFGFSGSLLIELLQIFTYRATDINDLITNTTGTAIGWALARLCRPLFPGLPEGSGKDVLWVCAGAFFVMFFLHPFLSELLGMLL